MRLVIFIFIITLILTLFYLFRGNYISVASKSGKSFKVRNNKNAVIAANLLDTVYNKGLSLANYMKENSLPNKNIGNNLYQKMLNVQLMETSIIDYNTEGFIINKGEIIKLKLFQNNKPINIDTLMYILLHEMAHLISISYGHTEEFKINFELLLKIAKKIGIYFCYNCK